MNFLTLCQAVARESGTLASLGTFTTVVGATDRRAKIVAWTRDAYIDLQNQRTDWLWLRSQFTKALTIGTTSYDRAALVLPRLKRFIGDVPEHRSMTLYDPALGKADEGEIDHISYERWLEMYDRGTHDSNRVRHWALSPERKLLVGPTPNKAYVLRGEYLKTPQELAVDADVPEMPEEHHRVIVFEALLLMKRSDRMFASLNVDSVQYTSLRSALVNAQTPDLDMETWGPLA